MERWVAEKQERREGEIQGVSGDGEIKKEKPCLCNWSGGGLEMGKSGR